MGAFTRPKLSGMQKQVLGLYRGFLQAACVKSPEDRHQIESIVSAEFHHNSQLVDRKNFMHIEYLLRNGNKQLEELKSRGTVGLSHSNMNFSQIKNPKENSDTKQSSSHRQTSLMQEIEFGSGSLSKATEEKHAVGTGNVNKGSTEVRAVEYGCIGFEQSRSVDEDMIQNLSCEQPEQQPEDATMNSNPHQLGLLLEDVTGKNLSATKQPVAEKNHVVVSECITSEALIEEQKIGTGNMQNEPDGTVLVESDHLGPEQPGPPSEEVIRNSSWEQLRPLPEDERMSSLGQVGLPPEDEAVNTSLEQLKPLPYYVSKNCDLEILEPLPEDAVTKPSKAGGRGRRTSAKSTKEKHAVRSSVGSARVLRSRLQEKSKAPEPSNSLAEHGDGANGEKRRKKRNKGQVNKIPVDEFSRIRTHLRYLLHRISYERNLIDAYSGEGWKGQSLEKLKPEKELQRAKSEIFRCKLKIRDLFQHLDSLIGQGRLPKCLFDSEGQIDSEDIFCAKCGSKDFSADNDIILCDGACERGFHQFCLEPPLLKEDIPPDDEGWLCPGCSCKVDCIRLLNISQGTNLSVLDTWEKVFPEAASGNKLDDHFGLPSDDSEDNDYDPDGSELDEKAKGNESSSNESDFYSASEDFGASPNNNQKLELPSDDSEDDDYDPNALDLDGQVKQESSSSDFTSDPEDFSVAFNDSRSQCKGEPLFALSDQTKPCGGSDEEGSKVSQREKQSLNNELLSILELGSGQGDTAPVPGKRHVERLDYGKLYDEMYGNVSCDSSDEEWTDGGDVPKRQRKNNIEEVSMALPRGRTPIIEGTNANDMKHSHGESESTRSRRSRTNNLPAKSPNNSAEPASSYGSTKRSSYRRLGEAVTQGLIKSFKENQYPERSMKENMAKQFGITVHQVSKWFENARWSFRHTSRMDSSIVGSVPQKGTPPQTNPLEPGPKMMADVACNGVKNTELSNTNAVVSMSSSLIEGYGRQGSTAPRSEEREWESDHQASGQNYSSIEGTVQKPSASVDLQKAPAVRKRARPKGSSKSTT